MSRALSVRAVLNTVVAVTLTITTASLMACGDDEAPDAERFCGEVDVNREMLTNPQLGYTNDVEELLELYRDIGSLAPLSIEEDWNQLILNYETASTVVPGDDDSLQRAVTVAYQSERAAVAVGGWLRENCGVDLGPVATLVEQPL